VLGLPTDGFGARVRKFAPGENTGGGRGGALLNLSEFDVEGMRGQFHECHRAGRAFAPGGTCGYAPARRGFSLSREGVSSKTTGRGTRTHGAAEHESMRARKGADRHLPVAVGNG